MSKFEVKILNSKNPLGAENIEKLNKRINELTGNPYQRMFEAENCDNENHADYLNKITLDMGTSRIVDLDCRCFDFTDKIKELIGAN